MTLVSRAAMPTTISVVTILGLLMQLPAMVFGAKQIAAGVLHGANAGSSATLSLPFTISLIVALIGGLMVLGTGVWSRYSEVGRSAGWSWVRWSSVVLIVIWLAALMTVIG